MTAHDDAAFLAGAPERWRVLATLRDAPATPAALADAVDASRRTVQRHLAAFADRDWVEKRDGAYNLTTTGALVARTHAEYLDDLDGIDRLEAVYAALPADAADLDPERFADATVRTATREDPQAPVGFYVDRVRALDTDRVRMLSPVLSRLYHDAHAHLARDGTHTELVLPTPTVERARSENPLEFRAVLGLGVLDLYRTPADVDLGVTLADDRVLLCAYADDGQLAACVDSTDDRVRAWATERYERHRDRGERVPPSRR
ncbi:ArsR family transcriptional regulator [Halorubellus sp. PRR65]|uniref:helix-turn-helix transcriptional regulator n=1 Tax=Halorubellus sp. PRR65 TaxID=3098148 RepID=UPI002B25E5AE|nr:ArsR family transcriptional regulator [Halorubellus sp. PRR65]